MSKPNTEVPKNKASKSNTEASQKKVTASSHTKVKHHISVTLAPLWKKVFAWIYDLLAAIAVFVLALLIGYLAIYLISLPWLENGESLSNSLSSNPLWLIYLTLAIQYYYVWCWVKGGQTVGMRTWNLKLCKQDGSLLSWKEAYIRSVLSLGGLAMFWSVFDKDKRGWHDIPCNCRTVVLPKDYKKQTKPLI
jgi:uncharacterized RDD family membrane protein YckC